MPLLLIGLNHKSAPVSVREKLAKLCGLKIPDVDGANLEAVPVFTCNRVEIYYFGEIKRAQRSFSELLATANLSQEEFDKYFYELEQAEAINHIFSVTSGLDSMILGENQILHQIKESYKYSTNEGYVGKNLHGLFQKALEVGKKVRHETGISENRVSIASTAVDLAKSIFGPLQQSSALIIGAGEMANLVAVHLMENGIKSISFTNRTLAKAQEMAQRFNGKATPIEEIDYLLKKADITITSTGAPSAIISQELMQKVMQERHDRPMFMIDIAVPRDIEESCGKLPNLFVYDVDDLQNVVNENLSQRKIEAEKAQAIVSYESSQFQITLKSFTVIPIIKALREKAEKIRQAEIEKFLSNHPGLPLEAAEAFRSCSRSLMAKWLHKPIIGLKRQGSADEQQIALISDILGIEDNENNRRQFISLSNNKRETA